MVRGSGWRRRAGHQVHSSTRHETGQATVELALTLPLVVLFSLMVVQAGLVAKDLVLVHHAAREGARAAAVDPTPAAARAGVTGGAKLENGRLGVSLSGGASEGDQATVRVTYASPTNVPIVGALVGDITLTADVTMRVE